MAYDNTAFSVTLDVLGYVVKITEQKLIKMLIFPIIVPPIKTANCAYFPYLFVSNNCVAKKVLTHKAR